MGAPSIRTAIDADLDALQEIFRRSSLSNEGDRGLLTARPDLLLLSAATVTDGRTRVAEVDGCIVGFASIVVGDGVGELVDIFVDPDRMRTGAGRALVTDAVALARQSGASRLEVDANRHALAFYREVGFVDEGEVAVEHGTALRMGMDL